MLGAVLGTVDGGLAPRTPSRPAVFLDVALVQARNSDIGELNFCWCKFNLLALLVFELFCNAGIRFRGRARNRVSSPPTRS